MSTPAPGWYPDPSAPGNQRYWDGTAWTSSTAPMPGYSAPREATELPAAPVAPAYVGGYAPGYGHAAAPPAPQVGFGDAIKLGFRKYATFDGRATRAEYWWWYLFTSLVGIGGYFVFLAVVLVAAPTTTSTTTTGTSTTTTATSAGAGILFAVLGLLWFGAIIALLIPTISVAVRRLHDTDRSGWWYWISLIPFGGIVLLVFFVTESTIGPNRYGPPSRGAEDLVRA